MNVFIDGATKYATEAEAVSSGQWASMVIAAFGTNIGAMWGRFGNGLRVAGNSSLMQRNLPAAVPQVTVGLAVFASNLPGSFQSLLTFADGGTNHVALQLATDGSCRLVRNPGASAVALKTSAPGTLVTGRWYYLEVQVTISDTAGQFEVRLDGVTVLDSTTGGPFDTRNGAAAQITNITYGGNAGTYQMADFYINDNRNDDGLGNTSFWGDTRVDGLLVDQNGDTVNFAPSSGTNAQCVDDGASPDGDTTFTESNTVGDKDLFQLSNLPSLVGTIRQVSVTALMKKTDANARSARAIVKSGGAQGNGATVTLSSTYAGVTGLFPRTPGGVAWTAADINAIQAGYEIVT